MITSRNHIPMLIRLRNLIRGVGPTTKVTKINLNQTSKVKSLRVKPLQIFLLTPCRSKMLLSNLNPQTEHLIRLRVKASKLAIQIVTYMVQNSLLILLKILASLPNQKIKSKLRLRLIRFRSGQLSDHNNHRPLNSKISNRQSRIL